MAVQAPPVKPCSSPLLCFFVCSATLTPTQEEFEQGDIGVTATVAADDTPQGAGEYPLTITVQHQPLLALTLQQELCTFAPAGVCC